MPYYDVILFVVRISACSLKKLRYRPAKDLGIGNFSSSAIVSTGDLDDPGCLPYNDGSDSIMFKFNLTMCHPSVVVDVSVPNYYWTIDRHRPAVNNTYVDDVC